MKQAFLLLAFLLMIALPTLAQIKVGVKAGGNYSTVNLSEIPQVGKPHFKPGFHAGLFLVLVSGKEFSVRQELLYNVKGWKTTDSIEKKHQHVNYLSQSFLLYLKATPKLWLLLGPEVGYLLNIRPKDNGAGIPEFDYLGIGSFNRLEAGFSGGISYKMQEKVTLEARYTQGVTNVLNWRLSNASQYYIGGNNQVFQVSMGYTFGKKSGLNKNQP